jgi:hypothetical protein
VTYRDAQKRKYTVTHENTDQPRRRGRPRKDNPLSAAERQQQRRQRQQKLELRTERMLGDLTTLTSDLTVLVEQLEAEGSQARGQADELRRFAERLLGEQREIVHACLPSRRKLP